MILMSDSKPTTPKRSSSRKGASSTRRNRKGRPTDADSAATRQSILDASLWAFGRHGYDGTSMQIIAERAGLTPGTLYHYFPSKADIFKTVGDEVATEFRRRSDLAIAEAHTARQRVAGVLRGLGDWILESPEVASFISTYAAEVTRNREVRRLSPPERWTEPVSYYAAMFHTGAEAGDVTADADVDAAGVFVQGLVYGMAAVVAVGRTFGPPDLVIETFIRAIEGSLFVEPGPERPG